MNPSAQEITLRACALMAFLVIVAMLAGCAGLSVNADLHITYRSDVPVGTRAK